MNYLEKLSKVAAERKSIVCVGLDPDIEAMPQEYAKRGINGVPHFIRDIVNEMKSQGVCPGAFKPNAGFYLKHDHPLDGNFSGSEALADVFVTIDTVFSDVPIILDFKRGDIAKSSANYAQEGFGSWIGDAVTVSPYMGSDSVGPFIESAAAVNRGVYILNRTSNPGAKDFQNLKVIRNQDQIARDLIGLIGEGVIDIHTLDASLNEILARNSTPLYMAVAEKIAAWAEGKPGVGAVVGATSLPELEALANFYARAGRIPLLIPGVGGQGGKADEVVRVLRNAGYDLSIVRINSSSDLTHPWAKEKKPAPQDYAKVCVANLAKLNETIAYQPAA